MFDWSRSSFWVLKDTGVCVLNVHVLYHSIVLLFIGTQTIYIDTKAIIIGKVYVIGIDNIYISVVNILVCSKPSL